MAKVGARGKMGASFLAAALLFLIAAGGASPVLGQSSSGTLKGIVLDADGEPLPGVAVTVTSERNGIRDKGGVTDAAGMYKISHLPAGKDYRLKISLSGYATYFIDVEVKAGRTTVQRITLRPDSELTDEITVKISSEVVDVEDRETKTRFSDEFIEGLPVVGRDYRDVLILAPGVNDDDGDGNVNILGSRQRDVLISLDGTNVNDPFTGQDAMDVNLEAIGEIELVRAGAGAQYGGKTGGFINIITKSGSNEFEGAFKFFLRSDIFDGDGAGTDPPEFHGGVGESADFRSVDFNEFRPFLSLGGAILKDKLWYFVSNEFESIDTPVNAVTQVFVTSDERFQEFAKLTWQATSAVKPSLSLNYTPSTAGNLGLDSDTLPESAFDLEKRRGLLQVEVPWILSPRIFLETTIGKENGTEERIPVLDPDMNRNGVLFLRPTTLDDRNLDLDGDGLISNLEDPTGFFGPNTRDLGEDFNGNGFVDDFDEDGNPDLCIPTGNLAPLCEGDRNGDGILDPPDRDAMIDVLFNVQSGPNRVNYIDRERDRISMRSALTIELDDFFGTHTVRVGGAFEQEKFLRDISVRSLIVRDATRGEDGLEGGSITAFTPVPSRVPDLSATSDGFVIYVDENYKPLPNLTLGVGFRFNREEIDSSGFTHFDPVAERQTFIRIRKELVESGTGLINADPLIQAGQRTAYSQKLIKAAVNQFTLHRLATTFDSDNPLVTTRLNERLDLEGGAEANSQRPEDFTITNNNLAPRLSFSWDPWADGKTKVFGTWGRYYDRIILVAVVAEQGPVDVAMDYGFDADMITTETGLFNAGFGLRQKTAAPNSFRVDRNLQSPFSNEFTFGFERELAPELSLSVTYIKRRWERQLQDIDINHSVNFKADGTPNDRIGRRIQSQDDSSVAEQPDGFPDLEIHSFFFNQIFFISNLNNQRYDGIELELTRRLRRNWQMQGSYTFGKVVGAAEDFFLEAGDDPSITENEFGYLFFDQRHVVKVSATTFLPKDVSLGGTIRWASGYPFSQIRRRASADNVGFTQLRRRYPSGRRNDQRNDAVWDFGLQLRKSFVIGKIAAAAQMDIENILNTDDLRVFELNDISFSNQVTSLRRFGRRFEFGLTLSF